MQDREAGAPVVDTPNQPATTPNAVRIVGWAWIGIGALMLLAGAGAFLVSVLTEGQGPASSATSSGFPAPFTFVFHHFAAFALAQVVLALAAICSAVMFLRLTSWARTGLELVSWLTLLYAIVLGVYFAIFWYGSIPAGPEPKGSVLPSLMFRDLGVVMAAIITAVNAVPLLLFLWWLRKDDVRRACNR